MSPLFWFFYAMIGSLFAGVGILAVLWVGFPILPQAPMLLAAVIGAIVAAPVAWYVTRALDD